MRPQAVGARQPVATPTRLLSRRAHALVPRKLGTSLLALVLLAAVPVFAVQLYDELERREQRRREVAGQVKRLAGLVAARLDRLIDNARVVLATLGRFPAIEARDRPAVRRRAEAAGR